MANTDDNGDVLQHALGEEHLAGCLALSKSANWNQNEADWRLMLEIGRGWGLSARDGTLLASTLALPYGGGFGWVSMVLVLPGQQRKGYASRLLRAAIADLRACGLTPILDATPAGHEVYLHEGFRDTWGFKRYQLDKAAGAMSWPSHEWVRPLEAGDWRRILEMDQLAFGASRERLLRALAARLPQAALVAQRNSTISGYLFGRDGREARQLGPLVAEDAVAAKALLETALADVEPPVYLDIANHTPTLLAWLETCGFVYQRPFTRMVYAADKAPGEEKRIYLVAGPELG